MNAPTPDTLFLIDGTAYVYRAYHAIRGLATSTGRPTNAVFGFSRMLLKLLEERRPGYIGMCFDAKGPTFRHDLYAEYKANRPPMPDDLSSQLPAIRAVTEAFNLPVVEQSGFEADDLIGTLARQATERGFSVVMVTGDKDFVQLVAPACTIWDPMKDRVIDPAAVKDEFDLEPCQIVDVMALAGDTSDNVPGVPGIGPKTAVKLIQRFGSLDAVYRRLEEIRAAKQRQNLERYQDQARLSRRLVTIDTAAPIAFQPERFRFAGPDRARLATLFGELEFRQLQHGMADGPDTPPPAYHAVLEQPALDALVERLRTAEAVAVDTETSSQNPMLAELVGISMAVQAHEAWYVPCGHTYLGAPDQLSCKAVLRALKPVLEDPAVTKIGQNIKYDMIVLARQGIGLQGPLRDTMVASYLLNPSKRAHNLDQIALDHLGRKTVTYAEVVGPGRKAEGFAQVPLERAVPYACEDADVTWQAHQRLTPRLAELGLSELLDTVEMPLIPVLMQMEMTGVAVDRHRLNRLGADFQRQLADLETQIYDLAGERFNIKSSQQLGAILFDKLQLPVQKKTRKKTGYSTDVDVLTTLAATHPLPERVLRHRTLAKLNSTYVEALLGLIHPATGRIHTSFNQTVAATGRLSSSDPNLQNIPVRTPEGRQIRSAFVPRPGWRMLSVDYSQIELRILAHCAEDPILIDAFARGEDIHARTAAEVFAVNPAEMSGDLRRQAKAVNFGIIYGMSAYGLSRQLGISQKMAQTIIDSYFARYAGVAAFMQRVVGDAAASGRTSTLLGRIRRVPDITSTNQTVRRFAERIAINTPIQGTAADLIKLAMIRMSEGLTAAGLQAAMLLSVHDEILFECPPEEVDALTDLARATMEGIWQLKVPLKVNIATGADWAEAH